MRDNDAAGLFDRRKDRLLIPRGHSPQIDDLCVNALLGKLLCRRQRTTDHNAVDHYADVLPLTGDTCLTDGNGVLFVRHLALHFEERLMLKEHDRIVVANGSLEQALALGRAGGNDYL